MIKTKIVTLRGFASRHETVGMQQHASLGEAEKRAREALTTIFSKFISRHVRHAGTLSYPLAFNPPLGLPAHLPRPLPPPSLPPPHFLKRLPASKAVKQL
jgi:hypothetical protein